MSKPCFGTSDKEPVRDQSCLNMVLLDYISLSHLAHIVNTIIYFMKQIDFGCLITKMLVVLCVIFKQHQIFHASILRYDTFHHHNNHRSPIKIRLIFLSMCNQQESITFSLILMISNINYMIDQQLLSENLKLMKCSSHNLLNLISTTLKPLIFNHYLYNYCNILELR